MANEKVWAQDNMAPRPPDWKRVGGSSAPLVGKLTYQNGGGELIVVNSRLTGITRRTAGPPADPLVKGPVFPDCYVHAGCIVCLIRSICLTKP